MRIPSLPFLNREVERDCLTRALAESKGHPLLLIEGEGGIGKSALIDDITQSLDDMLVILVRCDERSDPQDLVHAIVQSIKASTGHDLSLMKKLHSLRTRLLPRVGRSTPVFGPVVEDVVRLVIERFDKENSSASIRALLRKVSKETPLLLIYDDIHSLSPSCQDFIADTVSVLAETDEGHARIMLATRPLAPDQSRLYDCILKLAGDGLVTRCQLPPLHHKSMVELATRVLVNPGEATALLDSAAGNPELFRQSLARMNFLGCLESDGGLLRVVDHDARFQSMPWDDLLSDALLRHIAGLTALSVEPLSISSLTQTLLAEDWFDRHLIVQGIDRLCSVGICKETGEGSDTSLEPTHDTIRDEVILHLQAHHEVEYRYLHRILASRARERLASSKECRSLSITELAQFVISVPEIPQEERSLAIDLAHYAHEARDADWPLVSLGAVRIAHKYRRHSDVWRLTGNLLPWIINRYDTTSELTRRVTNFRLSAGFQLGEYAECISICRTLPSDSLTRQYYLGSSLHMINANREAAHVAQHAYNSAVQKPTIDPLLPKIVGLLAIALQESGEDAEARSTFERFFSDTIGQWKKSPTAWELAIYSPHFIPLKEAIRLCRKSVEFFESSDDALCLGKALNNLGFAQLFLGQAAKAELSLRRSWELLQEHATNEAVYPLNNLGIARLIDQDPQEAVATLQRCLFYRMAPHSEVSVRINLALAICEANLRGAPELSEHALRQCKMLADPFLLSLVTLDKAYIGLRSTDLSQAAIDAAYEDVSSLENSQYIACYWNRMMSSLCSQQQFRGRFLDASSSVPEYRVMHSWRGVMSRPSGLAFAH